MKKKPHVDDADVDKFVERFCKKLNPALTPEERADLIHDFALAYTELVQPETSKAWAKELARKVRSRALWLKPSN